MVSVLSNLQSGLGLWAGRNEWLHGLGPSPSTHDLASFFTADVSAAMAHCFPAKTVRFHPTDKPWITAHIKQLTEERQQAYYSGNGQMCPFNRRKVQTEIKPGKRNFYVEKGWCAVVVAHR